MLVCCWAYCRVYQLDTCTHVSVGKNYEMVSEMCNITLNKIAISGGNGTITPGGVRVGK